MITRTDIAKSLEYGVKAAFLEGRDLWTPTRDLIAEPATSTGKEETHVGLADPPMPVEAVDQVQVRGLKERYITIENKDWETTLAITHNAINDDRVGHVVPWMRKAGTRFEQHMDKRCWQALNGGDGDAYGLCYDGQYFFDTDHVDEGAEYVTAQSNLGTTTLTLDGFNTIWIAAQGILDSRGEYLEIPFDLLTVSPTLMTVAAQICNNENAYDTGNREVNPFNGKFRYHHSAHMGAASWAISCTLPGFRPIIFQLRQKPELVVWDDHMVAMGSGIRYMKWSARYEIGYANWRYAYLGKT